MKFWKFFKRIYEIAAEEMVSEIKDFIKEGERVLDFGCGSGILAKKLKEKLNADVLGVDIADERIEKIPFQKFDGRGISFRADSFETILISFVLHHTQNPMEILREAKRVAKKIIIFEDLPESFLGKLRCYIHLHSWNFLFKNANSNFNFFKEMRIRTSIFLKKKSGRKFSKV
jgi:2-polyprenyl-3-methyl-5-hydroxy-6-metoxy-1,4-benzoquinol methylase